MTRPKPPRPPSSSSIKATTPRWAAPGTAPDVEAAPARISERQCDRFPPPAATAAQDGRRTASEAAAARGPDLCLPGRGLCRVPVLLALRSRGQADAGDSAGGSLFLALEIHVQAVVELVIGQLRPAAAAPGPSGGSWKSRPHRTAHRRTIGERRPTRHDRGG